MDSLVRKNQEYYSLHREDMLDFVPNDAKTILDIGCGEGKFCSKIKANLNVELWGIEINQQAAKVAQDSLDKVLCGDINTLLPDIPDNYFDCIFFNDVLEHINDPFSLLENLKCKLSSKGLIIASIPNVRYINVLNSLIFNKDWEYTDEGILDYTHLRFFTEKSIKRMFEKTGYEIVKIQGINKTRQLRCYLWNILFLGLFKDSQYKQFACIAKPH